MVLVNKDGYTALLFAKLGDDLDRFTVWSFWPCKSSTRKETTGTRLSIICFEP